MTDFLVTVPGETLRHAIGTPPANVRIETWDFTGPAPAAHIDIAVPPYMVDGRAFDALEGITTQLVQGQSIGYDHVAGHLGAEHRFANAATVHETSTAELALGLMIASQRGIDRAVRAEASGTWTGFKSPSLADRRVMILGYGGVGAELERRLLACDALVTRVARTARESEHGPVFALTDVSALLPETDIVVLTVPLTAETTHLANAAFLAALPDGALVVNVARGPVADTAAILTEARSGRLRFALDVTEPEPLPQGHELFGLDNVIITPHVGGASSAMMPRMAALLHRQMGHLIAGEPFENIVVEATSV